MLSRIGDHQIEGDGEHRGCSAFFGVFKKVCQSIIDLFAALQNADAHAWGSGIVGVSCTNNFVNGPDRTKAPPTAYEMPWIYLEQRRFLDIHSI